MHSPAVRKSVESQGRSRTILSLIVVAILILPAGTWFWMQAGRSRRAAASAQLLNATPSPEAIQDREAALALNNYLTRLRAQVHEHEASYALLGQSRALSWNIREKDDIARSWKVVTAFLDTNKRLTESVQFGESYIRAELKTAKVPDSVRDSVLDLYGKTEKPAIPLELRVRECDQIIGENALAVLSLLETNWGLWKQDKATGRLDFTDQDAFASFRDHVGKIESAANDRKAAQDRLTEFRHEHPVAK